MINENKRDALLARRAGCDMIEMFDSKMNEYSNCRGCFFARSVKVQVLDYNGERTLADFHILILQRRKSRIIFFIHFPGRGPSTVITILMVQKIDRSG